MTSRRIAAASVFATAVAVAVAPSDARACGACFHAPTAPTVVSGHRMALAISPLRTVLWDQIQYQGDPSEFAWVLPVKPGATIEASTSAFFETLEAFTSREVQGPVPNCGGGTSFGCGVSVVDGGDSFDPSSAGSGGPVTVVHQGSVGPYETVTLHASEEGALVNWLTAHGYAIDDASQPIIDAYVAEGFDFIALRLQPGQGIAQMTPVRVVSPGATPSLPLRMVAIGTGANVPIVLYVVGEGRWTTQNFPEAHLPEALIAWDFADQTSNYADVRAATLAQNDGRSFLTAYAQRGTLLGNSFNGFMKTYFDAAAANGEAAHACLVNAPSSGVLGDGVDPAAFTCDAADDVAAALLGMHIEDAWVTRLEAVLPHDALDADLILRAADEQEFVSRTVQAWITKNGDRACGASFVPVTIDVDRGGPSRALPWVAASALAAAALAFGARRYRAVARPA